MVPIMEHYGDSSEVSIMLNHDFTERYYEIRYFGPMDILTICGGYNASIGPMLGLLSPIFVLNFLYQLAVLILYKSKNLYQEELAILHADYRKIFEKIDVENQEKLTSKQKVFLETFAFKSKKDLFLASDDAIMKDLVILN